MPAALTSMSIDSDKSILSACTISRIARHFLKASFSVYTACANQQHVNTRLIETVQP